MVKKIKIISGCLLVALIFLHIQACMGIDVSTEAGEYLEFTVVKGDDIPEDLRKQIDESKDKYFKITYKDDEYLYIANGYGKQKSGGYSVAVKEFYKLRNALYFKTELLGPEQNEQVNDEESYPYVVIKTEIREEPVVFR
ncbi:MAG: protease complex subunit PrcB family protein [Agathobacter sp.]|nr:protease complex subunit PrcB family protein [Agathobacter sp.]